MSSEHYLLNRECAVRSTPLIIWKSPLLKRVTMSVRRSGHFWGKSSLPMMLMASLSCGDANGEQGLDSASLLTIKLQSSKPLEEIWPAMMYLFLNLFRTAEHQIYDVCFDCCSICIRNFVWFIFHLQENKQQMMDIFSLMHHHNHRVKIYHCKQSTTVIQI